MSKGNLKGIYPEMARRSKRADRDNNDRWLVSYADFITLLFAFFVVMYAISSLNQGKYKAISTALNSAFNSPAPASTSDSLDSTRPDGASVLLVDPKLAQIARQQRLQQERMQHMATDLDHVLGPLIENGQVSIRQSGRGIVMDINVRVLFHEGDATLQNQGVATLAKIAQVLGTSTMDIEVEGHTDNIPIRSAQFPSNWELSSARASSVVRLFIREGVGASRLTAAGVAENHPLAPNDTPEHRARNRRVTITILQPQPSGSDSGESGATGRPVVPAEAPNSAASRGSAAP